MYILTRRCSSAAHKTRELPSDPGGRHNRVQAFSAPWPEVVAQNWNEVLTQDSVLNDLRDPLEGGALQDLRQEDHQVEPSLNSSVT